MVGRTLLHYKVIAELGAGGMGVVYEAVDLRLDRRVALKILPADKSDDQQRRARFLHEARSASALNDPHIVTVFDILTVDDTDVLVMELVPGRTLRQILDEGPLPLAKALDIATQVAEGVGAAHSAGVVHRDLKPGNVMVSDRGRVKVLDFGLAKLVGGSMADQPTTLAPLTVAGMLLGTVDYMSPEQARGDAIDARTDVFSLGAMLYEMIAGTRPFTSGHALGVLHEIVYGTIVPLRTRRPDATADIERIVSGALERDVTRRYQTMEAFGHDLREAHRDLLSGGPATRDTAAPVFAPPPLPSPAPSVPPAAGPSGSSYTPVAPPPISARPATLAPQPVVGGRSSGRRVRRRRPRWATFGLVIAIIYGVNWTRHAVFNPPEDPNTEPAARPAEVPTPSDIGTSVEDAIASGLLSVASQSADIQMTSARIYWKRARQTKDPVAMKKAADAFTEALRLGLDDASDEREARDTLREIAALRTAATEAPPASDQSSRPPAPGEQDPP